MFAPRSLARSLNVAVIFTSTVRLYDVYQSNRNYWGGPLFLSETCHIEVMTLHVTLCIQTRFME